MIIRSYVYYGSLVEPNINNPITAKAYDNIDKIEQNIESQTIDALIEGIRLCDNNVEITKHSMTELYLPCDILLTYGTFKKSTHRGLYIKNIFDRHRKYTKIGLHLVIEKGYIHRDQYYMIGWNGLNNRASFCNNNCISDRWNKLNIKLGPWQTNGDHILICEQGITDASVQHIEFNKWVEQTVTELRKYSKRKIIFRPHPIVCKKQFYNRKLFKQYNVITGDKKTPLNTDLRNCWCVVTFNSNVGVDAILKGIPVISMDQGSMVYNITEHDLKNIENPHIPCDEERLQWAYDIAYTQWTIDEMKQGLPWLHLKQYLNDIPKININETPYI